MHFLLSSLRSQVFGTGLTTFPVLYLVGLQNSGKTWLAEHYSLLYDNKETGIVYGNLDASSTDKGIFYAASNYKDMVIAVDDLPKASAMSVQRERLEAIEKSIRFIANGTMRETASRSATAASQRCQAGGVYTGEIPLRAASMLTRMLEVPLAPHKKVGRNSDRADAATAFRWWMLWLLPHLDEELAALKKRVAESSGGENARLETTKTLFLWVVELFYRAAFEQNFIEEAYYQGALDNANKVFSSLLAKQAEKVARIQDEPPRGGNVLKKLKGSDEERKKGERKGRKGNGNEDINNKMSALRE